MVDDVTVELRVAGKRYRATLFDTTVEIYAEEHWAGNAEWTGSKLEEGPEALPREVRTAIESALFEAITR
jgi:hypothetical protein